MTVQSSNLEVLGFPLFARVTLIREASHFFFRVFSSRPHPNQ